MALLSNKSLLLWMQQKELVIDSGYFMQNTKFF